MSPPPLSYLTLGTAGVFRTLKHARNGQFPVVLPQNAINYEGNETPHRKE